MDLSSSEGRPNLSGRLGRKRGQRHPCRGARHARDVVRRNGREPQKLSPGLLSGHSSSPLTEARAVTAG